jgi:hypothetical protein
VGWSWNNVGWLLGWVNYNQHVIWFGKIGQVLVGFGFCFWLVLIFSSISFHQFKV